MNAKKIKIMSISSNEESLRNYLNQGFNLKNLTILTGLNGCGKTHLLRYLSREINALGYTSVQINYIPYDWKADDSGAPKGRVDIEKGYDNELNSINSEFVSFKQEISKGTPSEQALPKYKQLSDLQKYFDNDGEWKSIVAEDTLGYVPPEFKDNFKDWNTFISFYIKWERARDKHILRVLAKDPVKAQKMQSQETPIDIINELFDKYNFEYRIKINENVSPIRVYFQSKIYPQVKNIGLDNLSSGEKMIVSLIMWAHNKKASKKIKCLLLDEPDAHLHPSLSKMFMEIIYEKFVKEYGMQVVIATHSPSTIAYTPEADDVSILFMDKSKKTIEDMHRSVAIKELSSGLMTLNQEEVELKLEEGIENIDKPILCVEGITDKIIIKNAWEKLHPDNQMPFYLQDMFDCYFVANTFKRGNIFCNCPDKLFIGLLDFDEAFKSWKEKVDISKYEKSSSPLMWRNKKYNGYVLPLPVPDSRKDEAGEDIQDSYLSIEKYFADEQIQVYCDEVRIAKGGTILKFKDNKKVDFAENTKTFDREKFKNFEILFSVIKTISQKEKNYNCNSVEMVNV